MHCLHKILIIMMSASYLQASSSEQYSMSNTYHWPVATHVGTGAAAGVLGAGLAFKQGNPYVTGVAGATLATLLAKRAWDTYLLPKTTDNLRGLMATTALSGLFGGLSGLIVSKIVQNRGWNPYILAAAAAGTGALCGWGVQYERTFLGKNEQECLKDAEKEKNDFIAIFSINKKYRNSNLSHWRRRASELPLLTDDQKNLIKDAYTEEQLVQIIEDKLPEETRKELQGLLSNYWFSWAKNILKSAIDEQEFKERLEQIRKKLYSYLLEKELREEAEMLKYLSDNEDIKKLIEKSENRDTFILSFKTDIEHNPDKYKIRLLLGTRIVFNLKLINDKSNLGIDELIVLLDTIIDDIQKFAPQAPHFTLPKELTKVIEEYQKENNREKKVAKREEIWFWTKRYFKLG